jgi:hypothetical protein
MIIHIERSGGVAGITFQKTINSESLPPKKVENLQTIIEKTDFFNLTSEVTTTDTRDSFQYTITIEHDSQSHSVTFDEKSLPKMLQSLIKKFK